MNSAVKRSQAQVEKALKACEPLFANTDITYFSSVRYYLDGTCLSVTTNRDIIQYIWENKLYVRLYDLQEFTEYSILSPDTSDRDKKICDLVNCNHMLRYFTEHDNYYEINSFGTQKHLSSMMEFYLNNLNLLKGFALYFRFKASKCFDEVTKDPILLKDISEGYVTTLKKPASMKNIQAKFESDKLVMQYKLSPREHECMKYLSEGMSTKEIARIIDLSPNTVQFYINNLKTKINCKKVAEIISLYFKSL